MSLKVKRVLPKDTDPVQVPYTRQLESARIVGPSYSIIEAYFDALSAPFVKNSYLPDDIITSTSPAF